ncbi:MAG TPA: GNAT family N-acetyltransferase, partial [Trueperaceae bacterium]|nr:GNAT family N-acetyltransferase [Trueperaceae bacterium]
ATAVPLSDGVVPASLEAVAESYRQRGLPPKVRWTPVAPASVATEAEAGGWTSAGEVVVMVAPRTSVVDYRAPPAGVEATILSAPDDGWSGVYLDANGDGSGPARLRLAVEAPEKKAYASIVVDGVTAAIGLGVVLEGTLGIFDLVTAPAYRRRGLARIVMSSLQRWGVAAGATSTFLQVHGGNAGAISLYGSLGFSTGYTYVYIVPPVT